MKMLQYIWKSSMLKVWNQKIATFAVVIAVSCWSQAQPLKRFVCDVDYPVSWCLFPFAMCNFSFLLLFWFGIIYINSDVPFMQHINMYHVLRTGRKRWAMGQIGGILNRSFAAVLFTAVCTALPVAFHLELTNEWGKLLKTAAMTNVMSEYEWNYIIYYEIFGEFTPLQLMAITVALCTLISTFVGMLMFLICLYANRICSVAGAAAFALLLFFVLNMHPKIRQKLAFFVPAVWPNVARIATPDYGYYWLPPIYYMFLFLLSGIAVMSAIIILRVKKIEFHWENSDL